MEAKSPSHKIELCMGSSCHAHGNDELVAFVKDYLGQLKIVSSLELVGSLCHGKCGEGPVIRINGKLHTHMDEKKILALLENLETR